MRLTDASSHQLATLRLYGALIDEREDWGGGLVLCCGEGCVSDGIAAAVSVAGGATLAIDSDAGALKSAMRLGELDFVVNTLDEALRALKNEIRQRRPLSVGLIAEVASALDEVVERGVQPELLLIGINQSAELILQNANVQALTAAGMHLKRMDDSEDEPGTRAIMLSSESHHEVYFPAAGAVQMRALDERLRAVLPPDDLVRRRWIDRVPRYLRAARSGGRWVWLSEEERQQMGR